MNWGLVVKLLGQALLSVLTTLLTGKTFRTMLLYPFERLAQWTKSTQDDKLVEAAKQDLGLDEKENSDGK